MWILFLSAVELLFFRHWSKIQNTPPISQLPLLAILLAFGLFFQILLERGGRPRLKPQWGVIAFHGALWVFLIWGGVAWEGWIRLLGDSGARLTWYLSVFLAVGTSLLVWVDRREVARRLRGARRETVFLLLASSAFALYESFHQHLWAGFSSATIPPVQLLLGWIGVPVQVSAEDFTINHPQFQLRIAAACSGLEGMAFFMYVFSLVQMLGLAGLSGGARIAAGYLAGMGWMFTLNIVRITLFFKVALWAGNRWGKEGTSALVQWVFHSHAGWALYLAGITLFIGIFSGRQPTPRSR